MNQKTSPQLVEGMESKQIYTCGWRGGREMQILININEVNNLITYSSPAPPK